MCGVSLVYGALVFARCSSDEYTPTYSTMMLGGLDLMNQSSWEDLLVSPQTESVQPMDYGPGDSG